MNMEYDNNAGIWNQTPISHTELTLSYKIATTWSRQQEAKFRANNINWFFWIGSDKKPTL